MPLLHRFAKNRCFIEQAPELALASNGVAAEIRRDIRNSPLAGRCFRFAESDRDDGKRIDKHRTENPRVDGSNPPPGRDEG